MKLVRYILLSNLFILLCGVNSLVASELTYPIVATGQVQTFGNHEEINAPKKGEAFYGQDAQFITNEMSYTDNGDNTITDNITGLMWQKSFKVMSYKEALKELKTLNKKDKYKDWRLPTIKELYSIIDFNGTDVVDLRNGGNSATPFINTNYFDFEYGSNGDRIIDTQLLSSTIYTSKTMQNDETVFGLNVADGRIKGYPMKTRNQDKPFTVRFVRGNKDYGINKFVDNKDNTITDKATGLMWSKDDSKECMTWQSGLDYVQRLNDEQYLGYSDWRLPNAKELHTIVDYTRSPKATSSAAIDPLFNTTRITVEDGSLNYAEYWTSTTHKSAGKVSGAMAVYISFGEAMGFMQMRAQQRPQGGQQGGGQQGGGNRPSSGGMRQQQGVGSGNRPSGSGAIGQQQGGGGNRPSGGGNNNARYQLLDVHGAGAQRSDPKTGDPSDYAHGHGPQGDAIRIYNYVRAVRSIS